MPLHENHWQKQISAYDCNQRGSIMLFSGSRGGFGRESDLGGVACLNREDRWRILLDRCLAALSIAFFASFLLVIAVIKCASDGGPVFVRAPVSGRKGCTFNLPSFRTRTHILDSQSGFQPTAPMNLSFKKDLITKSRRTCVGAFLARTGLDRLLQLFNILASDMVFVGPKPTATQEKEDPKYELTDVLHPVRPAIFVPSKIAQKSYTTRREKREIDARYVRSRSLRSDAAVTALSLYAMLFYSDSR